MAILDFIKNNYPGKNGSLEVFIEEKPGQNHKVSSQIIKKFS